MVCLTIDMVFVILNNLSKGLSGVTLSVIFIQSYLDVLVYGFFLLLL